MTISYNLSDIRNPQYEAVTGRTRKVPYQTILSTLAPTIRADARAEDLDALREKELLDAETRFNTQLSFDREVAAEQQAQAEKATMIQGANTAVTGAFVADKAGLIDLKDIAATAKAKIFGSAPTATAAIPGAAAPELVAVGAGEGATLTSAAGSQLMGAGGATAGTIEGAAIAPELIGEAGAGGSAGVGGGSAAGGSSIYSSYALPAAAAYLGSQVGGFAGQKVGEALDVGGYRERGFVGRVGGGALAGTMILPGIGTAIGATVGLIDWGFNEGKEFFSDVGEKIGDFAEDVWDNTFGQVFCFAAGTPVRMADGTEKPVEELRLFDEVLEGGMVYGRGEVLAADLYDHHGAIVSSEHAALEDGRWIRIHESPNARRIETPDGRPIPVYPVVTEHHLLIVAGRVYADMQETDHGTHANDAFRLAWLNEQTERNRDLEARYAA